MEAFYTFNERFAKIRSQRIKKAVKGITGNQASELMDDTSQVDSETRKKRKISPSATESNISEKPSDGMNDGNAGNETTASGKTTQRRPKKRGTENQFKESEVGQSFVQKAGRPKARNEPRANARGRGRGRAGRGKRNVSSNESTETSSSDSDDNDSEKQIQIERKKEQSELRRVSDICCLFH